jgi:hypothetical protein
MRKSNLMSLLKLEGPSKRVIKQKENREGYKNLVKLPLHNNYLEIKSIKQKKKLIDKLMKMR